MDYIQRILDTPLFSGRLTFAIYRDTDDYLTLTVETIARALKRTQTSDCKVTVLIDALPKAHRNIVSNGLRAFGIRTRKVRGVRKDEHDPLIRLADAICGLVRASHEGQDDMKRLLKQGIRKGTIEDLTR